LTYKKVLMVVVGGWGDAGRETSAAAIRHDAERVAPPFDMVAGARSGEAVMESTAQYWRSVWMELEPHMRLHLAQAFTNRAPRGRKHDFKAEIAGIFHWHTMRGGDRR